MTKAFDWRNFIRLPALAGSFLTHGLVLRAWCQILLHLPLQCISAKFRYTFCCNALGPMLLASFFCSSPFSSFWFCTTKFSTHKHNTRRQTSIWLATPATQLSFTFFTWSSHKIWILHFHTLPFLSPSSSVSFNPSVQ